MCALESWQALVVSREAAPSSMLGPCTAHHVRFRAASSTGRLDAEQCGAGVRWGWSSRCAGFADARVQSRPRAQTRGPVTRKVPASGAL